MFRGAPNPSSVLEARQRGQTTFDFIIGISIFLVTIAFIFAFFPELIDPVSGSQENPVVAERAARTLAGGLIGSPIELATLNQTCTEAFFTQSGGSQCGFDTSNSVQQQLGIPPHVDVNVTLEREIQGEPGTELLCTDGADIETCPGGDRLAVGESVPQSGNTIVSARRTVFVDGEDALLVVRIW